MADWSGHWPARSSDRRQAEETKADRIGAIAGDLCSVEKCCLKELMGKLGATSVDCLRMDRLDPRWTCELLFNATIAGIDQADAS